jgi:hypothetical protein
MIYAAPHAMFLMRADPLRGQVGGVCALEIETFLGPVKRHRAVRRVPFRAQKSREIISTLQPVHFSSHLFKLTNF